MSLTNVGQWGPSEKSWPFSAWPSYGSSARSVGMASRVLDIGVAKFPAAIAIGRSGVSASENPGARGARVLLISCVGFGFRGQVLS